MVSWLRMPPPRSSSEAQEIRFGKDRSDLEPEPTERDLRNSDVAEIELPSVLLGPVRHYTLMGILSG